MPSPADPTLRITTMDEGELMIPHARRLAEAFFDIDPSSRISAEDNTTLAYDDWGAQTQPDRFELDDLKVLNTSMRARSPEKWWTGLLEEGHLDWLANVDRSWDLLMPEAEWEARGVADAVESLMLGMLRKGIDVSVATKALHLKRPALVPVLDSLVIAQIGAHLSKSGSKRETRARQTREIVVHLRRQGMTIREELMAIQMYLRDVAGKQRTLTRILDGLLWSSHPDSLIAPVALLIERWDAQGRNPS